MKDGMDLRSCDRAQLIAQSCCRCECLDGSGFSFAMPGGLLADEQRDAMAVFTQKRGDL